MKTNVFAHLFRGLVILALGVGNLESALAASEGAPRISLLSVQDQVADHALSTALDVALRFELSKSGPVVSRDQTRDALRQLRIRNGDQAAPELLQELGRILDAQFLVTVTLHDMDVREIPQLTVSAMLYDSGSGELLSGAFDGRSGADGHHILGIGFKGAMQELIPLVAVSLVEDLMAFATDHRAGSPASLAKLGVISVVPFDGLVEANATVTANTLTRALEVALLRGGAELLSPNRTHQIVRQFQVGKWGSVSAETRMSLHSDGSADTLITGSVESYGMSSLAGLPNPKVGFSMRQLDASSGHITWTGETEQQGASRASFFRIGRIYSRGDLTIKLIENLVVKMGKNSPRMAAGIGGNG